MHCVRQPRTIWPSAQFGGLALAGRGATMTRRVVDKTRFIVPRGVHGQTLVVVRVCLTSQRLPGRLWLCEALAGVMTAALRRARIAACHSRTKA